MRYLLVLAIALFSNLSFGQEESGKQLFTTYCKACHSIEQNLVGPALKDVEERRDSAWIYSFIKGSQAMVDAGDSVAVALFNQFNKIPMPNQPVDDDQIGLILDYIEIVSSPVADSDNPIKRPLVNYGKAPTMLAFDNYMFWIPFTLTVILFIFMMYYMTVVYDFMKSKKESTDD